MSQTVNAQNSYKNTNVAPRTSDMQKKSIQKFREGTMNIRFVLGLTSLIIGLLAANLALFHWVERAGLCYLLGEYARYVCAYGGFSAMIFGAMLVNDYIRCKNVLERKTEVTKRPLPTRLKKGNAPKRVVRRGFRIVRKVVVTFPLTAFFFMLLPIAFSLVSYTATVGINVKSMPIYYLHRIDLSGVNPAGKLMNTTQPPSSQSEILYELLRDGRVYFYSPMLSQGSIPSGTWFLYLWASTASAGKVSSLTVQIHIVSSDGSVEKAVIGSVSDVVIGYGYSERVITITGSYANISSTDRIRLTLYAQAGSENDNKG
jgi:hypothetical protein